MHHENMNNKFFSDIISSDINSFIKKIFMQFILLTCFAIPSALMGAEELITSACFFIYFIVLIILTIRFIRCSNNIKKGYLILRGLDTIFWGMLCVFASYKLSVYNKEHTTKLFVLFVIVFLSSIIIWSLFGIYKLKNEKRMHSFKDIIILIGAMFFFSLIIFQIFYNIYEVDPKWILIEIMAQGLFGLSIISGFGMLDIIKAFKINKSDDRTEN